MTISIYDTEICTHTDTYVRAHTHTHTHWHTLKHACTHTHIHTHSSILNSSHLEQRIEALFLDCSTIPSLCPQSTTQLQQVFSIGTVLPNTLLQSVTRDRNSMHSTFTLASACHTTLILATPQPHYNVVSTTLLCGDYLDVVMHHIVMWGLSWCCYASHCYVGILFLLLYTTLLHRDYLSVAMHHIVLWDYLDAMWGLSCCCYTPHCYVGTVFLLSCITLLCGDYLDVVMHHIVMWGLFLLSRITLLRGDYHDVVMHHIVILSHNRLLA